MCYWMRFWVLIGLLTLSVVILGAELHPWPHEHTPHVSGIFSTNGDPGASGEVRCMRHDAASQPQMCATDANVDDNFAVIMLPITERDGYVLDLNCMFGSQVSCLNFMSMSNPQLLILMAY